MTGQDTDCQKKSGARLQGIMTGDKTVEN
jgi:hypothetical protein